MSEKHLTIAVDCDDTLVPTAEKIIDAYYHEYNVNISTDDFYSRDPEVWGVDDYSQAVSRVGRLLNDSDFMHSLEPFDYSIDVIDNLARKGVSWYMVTGRSQDIQHVTEDMINKYFRGMFKGVEHTNHFNASLKRTKGEVCRSIGAGMLIDDHLEHINSVLNEGNLNEAIVYGGYGWNRSSNIGSSAIRCSNWLDVQREVLKRVG